MMNKRLKWIKKQTEEKEDFDRCINYLESVDYFYLQKSIEDFKRMTITDLLKTNLKQKIRKVLNIQSARMSVLPFWSYVYPDDLIFFRVRIIDSKVTINNESECWYAPPGKRKSYRFNKENEIVLYTSLSPGLAIRECDVKKDDEIIMTVYKIKKRFTILSIGLDSAKFWNMLNEEQKKKIGLINDFVTYICTLNDNGKGDIYPVTNAILNVLYPGLKYDAIAYPSAHVSSHKEYNVVFTKNIKENLEVLIVKDMIYEVSECDMLVSYIKNGKLMSMVDRNDPRLKIIDKYIEDQIKDYDNPRWK